MTYSILHQAMTYSILSCANKSKTLKMIQDSFNKFL